MYHALDLNPISAIASTVIMLVIVTVLLLSAKVHNFNILHFILMNILYDPVLFIANFPVGLLSTSFSNCNTGDIRLINGSNPLEGRLEICINNAWGTVCHDSFSKDDAEVACRQLGNITGTSCTLYAIYSIILYMIQINNRRLSQLLTADLEVEMDQSFWIN